MATTYSFKGTADFSQHDAAVKKAGQEVDKYKEKCKSAGQEAQKMGNTDFSSAYRSQAKLNNGVKGFTNTMNSATRGITGMIGKAGIWGAAISGAILLGKKAVDRMAASSDRVSDAMARNAAGMKAAWDTFFNSLAEFNFDNFITKLETAVAHARTLADILDQQQTFNGISNVELANLQNQFERQMMELETARGKLKTAQKTKNTADEAHWNSEINRLEGVIERTIAAIGNLYERQAKHASNAAAEAARKYNFGSNSGMGIPSNVIRAMNTIVADEVRRMGATPSHALNWATFGKYLDSGGNPNWNEKTQGLARILDLIEKLFMVRGGDVYEMRQTGDKPASYVTGWNTTKTEIPRVEWQNLFDELMEQMESVFGIAGASKLGSDARGEAIKVVNGLAKFNESLRNSISQMEKDTTFTDELMQAAQSESAFISNQRRFNQTKMKDEKVTTTGPSYAKNTIGWYEKEIQKLNERLKKTGDEGVAANIKKQINDYKDAINKISMGEGSIEYITSRMKSLREEADNTSVDALTDAGESVRQGLLDEYYTLAQALVNLQWPEDTPQWVKAQISILQEKMGEAFDETVRRGIQAEIDSYGHVLNQLEHEGDALGFVQAELASYEKELSRATGSEAERIRNAINELNHQLNDLQNKKGSIDWINQEISLLTKQLNASNSASEITSLTDRITGLRIELAKLQALTQSPIEIKVVTDIDKLEMQIQRINSVSSSCVSIANSLGSSFGYIGEIIQGGKDWDELSESQQKTIETLNQLETVMNRLGDTLSRVADFFTALAEADIAATHAANTVAIESEATAQANLNTQKAIGAGTAAIVATTEETEAPTHVANAAALGVETAAAQANAVAKAEGAVSEVAEGAAKSTTFPANLAVMAAAIAAAIAILGTIASVAGLFANGGIVGGSSYYGDHQIARVNSGEMILNKRQQANMFNLLNGVVGAPGSSSGGAVDFRIRGTDLVGVLNNHGSRMKRIS